MISFFPSCTLRATYLCSELCQNCCFPFSIVEAGYKAHGYTCDLTKKTQIDDVSAKIKAEVGDVSILINNAGVVNGKSLLELTEG